MTYELGVTCSEGLILDVIEGDFDGCGVCVSEYHVDIDVTGVEDTDAEGLNEFVELSEFNGDEDTETVLDGDNLVEPVNLLVPEEYNEADESVLLVLETV